MHEQRNNSEAFSPFFQIILKTIKPTQAEYFIILHFSSKSSSLRQIFSRICKTYIRDAFIVVRL
jgi:hypothetical protein